MRLVLIFIFLLISISSHSYHEKDIIYDPNTSEEMNKRKQALLDKYDEGHFPQEDIEFYTLEIHYAWTANFDFLPPILKNCRENIR